MRKFERIHVEKGQAYIRDTGITVSEIVKRVVSDQQTFNQVVAEYPMLNSTDVEDVMAYSVSDLIETIAVWQNEGLGPLSHIKGYSSLLLERADLTQDQKKQFTEIIFRSSHQAVAKWRSFSSWVYKTYRYEKDTYQSFSIDSIVRDVLRELPEYDPIARVIWDVAEGLPNMRAGYSLTSAIVNILTDRTSLWLNNESTVEISSADNGFVNFRILRQFEHESQRDLSHEHILGWRSSPLSLAILTIQEHGSELQINVLNESVIFKFSLPIWDTN